MVRPNSRFLETDRLVLVNIALVAISLVAVACTFAFGTFDTTAGTMLKLVGFCCFAVLLNAGLFVYPAARREKAESSKMSKKTQSLAKQATTDALTGMHNRRYFEDALRDYLGEFNKIGATLGLLILDLDHFKSVNDNYGHDVGDLVLREVALRMRSISREHDICARLGGEEFAVITPYASREQLLGVAERYRQMVEQLAIKNGNVLIKPTVSIGVATNEGGVTNPDDLFKAADKKLYDAKHAGRNRVAA